MSVNQSNSIKKSKVEAGKSFNNDAMLLDFTLKFFSRKKIFEREIER
jgi:hypothetical protein